LTLLHHCDPRRHLHARHWRRGWVSAKKAISRRNFPLLTANIQLDSRDDSNALIRALAKGECLIIAVGGDSSDAGAFYMTYIV
jgi:hypothetical protein